MATPTQLPTMPAKREGDCPFCPHLVHRGDWISKAEPVGWGHKRCAENYVEIFEEHRQDDDPYTEESS